VILGDGQRLLAFNDLFIGTRTHTSARYRISVGSAAEAQSSSGVLVSTGAGSTGWMSSVFQHGRRSDLVRRWRPGQPDSFFRGRIRD
jgi:hypothetical protein